jgi:hypothetical protein
MSPTRRNFIKAALGIGAVAILPEAAFAKPTVQTADRYTGKCLALFNLNQVEMIWTELDFQDDGSLVRRDSTMVFNEATQSWDNDIETGRWHIAGADERLTIQELMGRIVNADAEGDR